MFFGKVGKMKFSSPALGADVTAFVTVGELESGHRIGSYPVFARRLLVSHLTYVRDGSFRASGNDCVCKCVVGMVNQTPWTWQVDNKS